MVVMDVWSKKGSKESFEGLKGSPKNPKGVCFRSFETEEDGRRDGLSKKFQSIKSLLRDKFTLLTPPRLLPPSVG